VQLSPKLLSPKEVVMHVMSEANGIRPRDAERPLGVPAIVGGTLDGHSVIDPTHPQQVGADMTIFGNGQAAFTRVTDSWSPSQRHDEIHTDVVAPELVGRQLTGRLPYP